LPQLTPDSAHRILAAIGEISMKHIAIKPALAGAVLLMWPLPAAAQMQASECGFYSTRTGGAVARYCPATSQAPPVQRVVALCRDGSFSYDQSGACFYRGGVAIWRR
jgi:hypothetical protein